jgi:hypothetical protein
MSPSSTANHPSMNQMPLSAFPVHLRGGLADLLLEQLV